MFWLVRYRRACDPEMKVRIMIIEGPDNDADAQMAFATFEPHAIEVSAKNMAGLLTGVIIQSPHVSVLQPNYGNPFSSN